MRQAGTYSGIRFGGNNGGHCLPLARIKKIMKSSGSGDEVKMISGEAPIVLAKACELLIKDLAHKSWTLTLQGKRRILHKDDVVSAVVATDVFDFLVALVSHEDHLLTSPADERDQAIFHE
ncbi:nuclear transcription factor Y subunit C-3-like [Humulus lupulus]|uniref:nuclear transcription factor Y subunit C-3-like n=1 Tax=Humulus lupulus TaxID=3486 RepID=UPI002B4060D1|nr:nuclear transcription factor Y subunit C-3-like [Humulus lupulus]